MILRKRRGVQLRCCFTEIAAVFFGKMFTLNLMIKKMFFSNSKIVRNMNFFVKCCAWNHDLRSTVSGAFPLMFYYYLFFFRTLLSKSDGK